jgi:uncharacterized membrane protein YhiD involved in acid resistance
MQEQGLPPEFAPYLPDALQEQVDVIAEALVALPLATVLGAALAFRPRRRGTPPRSASVIQTQIVLAVVGALVMFVVGSSLARAFGIVGAANLIRYRARIDDPKDAVVMLATLSIGLATGVGLLGLAVFGTLFILAVLWLIESLEPERKKSFELKVSAPDPVALRPGVESVLRQFGAQYELRTLGQKELVYQSELPIHAPTDRIANAILRLEPAGETEVAWEEKKKK